MVPVLINNVFERPAIILCGRYVAPIKISFSSIATEGNEFLTVF
jgi:hypothetical protein